MIVLVSGTRFPPASAWLTLTHQLEDLHNRYGIEVVIHGGADGIDVWGGAWAQQKGVPEMVFPYPPAYGEEGGPIRNGWMLQWGHPNFLLALPLKSGKSGGTWNMIQQAARAKVQTRVVPV